MSDSHKKKFLVIHGPNLNMLGRREPDQYGSRTLKDINEELKAKAVELGVRISAYQSNHEGDIVECIQKAAGQIDGLIINPAAFTHTVLHFPQRQRRPDGRAVDCPRGE